MNIEPVLHLLRGSPTNLTVDGFGTTTAKSAVMAAGSKYFTTKYFPDLVRLSERGKDCGLLPVSPPVPSSNDGAQWKVGIDFGTSFTNFYIDDGAGPSRKHLDTRVKSLTLSQKESRQSLLNQYFIPEEMLPNEVNGGNPPTATALSVRGWQEITGQVPSFSMKPGCACQAQVNLVVRSCEQALSGGRCNTKNRS